MAKLAPTFLVFFLLFAPLEAKGPGLAGGVISGITKLIKKTQRKRHTEVQIKDSSANGDQSSGPRGLQAQLRWSNDQAYVLELEVGTPARNVSLIVDTFDDFIWNDCLRSSLKISSVLQPYYPSGSNTFRSTSCDGQQWDDALDYVTCERLPQCRYNCSWAAGVLANETFRFQGDGTPSLNLSFGCNDVLPFDYENSTGYAGIGRGPLSLISQLSYSKFSYCFPDAFDDSISSYMYFGSFAELDDNVTDVNTTPFMQDNSSYFLDLQGISVGSKRLAIPPEKLQYVADYSGTVIYTANTATYLVQEAYEILKEEVNSSIGLPSYDQDLGYDLCFNWTTYPDVQAFNMTFHFAGANMTLPFDNLFVYFDVDESTTALCLMIVGINGTYSYIGSFQQQNLQYIYDLQNNQLTFGSIKCDQLRPHKSGAIKFDLHGTTIYVLFLLYVLLV